jgi:ankyrin repeat protein
VDSDGESPLHLACNGGHSALARLLLSAGADACATNAAGTAPADLAEAGSELAGEVRAAAEAQRARGEKGE